MKLVVLASATDAAAESEREEIARFAQLKQQLEKTGVTIEVSLNLLGRYDYLFVMDIPGGPENAFRAMSVIAQSGTMRTESFIAMPLDSYFEMAAEIGHAA
jgi:uncharacterized protein with GYD domain